MQEEHLEQKGFYVGVGASVKAPVLNFVIDDTGITIAYYTGMPRHYDWNSMKSVRIDDEEKGPIIIECFHSDIHIWNYDDMSINMNLVKTLREKISYTSNIEKEQILEKRRKRNILIATIVSIVFLLSFVFGIIAGYNFLSLLTLGLGWVVVMVIILWIFKIY